MFRASGVFLVMLMAGGAVLAEPARAQHGNANSYGRNSSLPPVIEQPLPPPGATEQPDLPYPPEADPADRMPRFLPPDDAPEVYGRRQLENGRPATAAPAGDERGLNPIRPPADIGASPAPAVAPPERSSPTTAALPPDERPEEGQPKALPSNLRRQLVNYQTKQPAGTVIIDTQNTYLYLVLGHGQALRYGIGVGREGFTWSGAERISRMKEWPDWFPPPEMIERQPYLPRMMAGGSGNPLGARALYLGHTLYRIHGTNQPSTIGTFVSSGCIRLLNSDIEDLYSRVQVGTRVVVLPGRAPNTANNNVPGASATRASVMVEPSPDNARVPPVSQSPRQ